MRLRNVKGAFDKVEASEYIIHDYKCHKGNYKKIFNNNNPICIEIGMGKGDFILGMSKKYPDINFIGIEKFDNVIIRAIEKIEEKNLKVNGVEVLLLGNMNYIILKLKDLFIILIVL